MLHQKMKPKINSKKQDLGHEYEEKDFTINDLAKRQVELQTQHEQIYNLLKQVADEVGRAMSAAENAESKAREIYSFLEESSFME